MEKARTFLIAESEHAIGLGLYVCLCTPYTSYTNSECGASEKVQMT